MIIENCGCGGEMLIKQEWTSELPYHRKYKYDYLQCKKCRVKYLSSYYGDSLNDVVDRWNKLQSSGKKE